MRRVGFFKEFGDDERFAEGLTVELKSRDEPFWVDF